ncbi:MAG: SDR family NAD(P)-dependent oxidoreductase [Dethiobacteria bacterium]|jgi:NAD(P)-dependent dehydrogenase (short-subunit alcohol dehydrogenase family)|nr:glucose 1-dehydrogenase [Bacillota bacterium]
MKDGMMSLKGETAVVTGSTKGLGKGLAWGLAKAGADLVIVSRHQEDCEKVAQEIAAETGVRTLPVAADLTKEDALHNLVQSTLTAFDKVDILVNNAGTSLTKKAEDLTVADWDRVLNLNLKAAFFCARGFGKKMIAARKGKIINIASILGLVAEKQVLPYCVAKGGLIQMTKALALEWARYNIQVNALCPGYLITDLNREQLEDERIAKHLLSKIAVRRFAKVEDMVGAVVYLASPASNYMTGQTITVDGGWTAQ